MDNFNLDNEINTIHNEINQINSIIEFNKLPHPSREETKNYISKRIDLLKKIPENIKILNDTKSYLLTFYKKEIKPFKKNFLKKNKEIANNIEKLLLKINKKAHNLNRTDNINELINIIAEKNKEIKEKEKSKEKYSTSYYDNDLKNIKKHKKNIENDLNTLSKKLINFEQEEIEKFEP